MVLQSSIVEGNLLETTTTTTINTLSDDLIAEILFRLSMRNFLELKSVCKSWKILISDSLFARNHIQRSMTNPLMTNHRLAYSTRNLKDCRIGFFSVQSLLENVSSPSTSSSNPTKVVGFEMEDCLEILGSCNGLLCLLDVLCNFVQLWNPCTGLESEWLEIEKRGVGVMNYGFGYDHVHDKYKLLLFVQKRPSEPKIPMVFDRHWVIVFFDLGKEIFGKLSLPFMEGKNVCDLVLQVARECLCVCIDHQKSHFNVWMMKEHGVEESWTRLIVISHVELTRYEPEYPLDIVYIYENGVVMVVPPTNYKLVLYDPNDNWLHYPEIDSSSDGMTKFPMSERAAPRGFHIYHESLVSPSHLGLPCEVS
ncbi:hypothetical protein PIB30_043965 [Stylosanthes scabra]|uniref:F-box domain-containing protein n=1 Tax=Stylosanthes scabra TaxID=79078 RepID=A0ABU6QF42_9FABA|nr:hypothetical protein [Stylosanthes scabra]